MPSTTVENYVKQLYLEQQRRHGEVVPMGVLAELMHVAPGTATSMAKTLAQSGLIHYEPRTGARLTEGGTQLSLHILRRHRIVELFLVTQLGLHWSEVHDEAEELEHVISDRILERMDELLGFPGVDPHGDPIPTPQSGLDVERRSSLLECELARPLRVARILDQNAVFLTFVERHGLVPGAGVTVKMRDAQADAVVLSVVKGDRVTLGAAAARNILVEPR